MSQTIASDLTQPQLTDDAYYNAIYEQVGKDIKRVLGGITVTDDQRSLAELFGEPVAGQVTNILINEAITPLINALANLHKTTQVIDMTTNQVLKTDMVIHRIPDIFLFSQQLAALRDSCNVYFDPAVLLSKYPSSDGWTTDILLPENHAIELDREAGVEYAEDDAPLRNVNISVVTTDGTLRERVRYCNFSYLDTKTQTQQLTDIPAFWDENTNEFLITTAIALVKLRPLDLAASDLDVTGDDIIKAYANNVVVENDPVAKAIFEANHANLKDTETKS